MIEPLSLIPISIIMIATVFLFVLAMKIGKQMKLSHEAFEEIFMISMSNFYNNLLKSQQPLPPDFQKVLNDNRWDLITQK